MGEEIASGFALATTLGKQPLRGLVVLLYQLVFVHSDKLTFFDDELPADNGVIRVAGLTEDNRRNGIVHPGESEFVQVDGEEVGTVANFERADVFTSEDCRAAACAEVESFAGGH